MLKNYLKIAWRNLWKNKVHSLINIGGLACGIAIFILISFFTRHEMSYNHFHKNYKNIYQIQINNNFNTTAPLAQTIETNLQGFDQIVRIDRYYGGGMTPIVVIDEGNSENSFKLNNVLFASDKFFSMFDFKGTRGNLRTALNEPNSIVLTQTIAQKLFGSENAVGKTLRYIGDRSGNPKFNLTVTAVIEDNPTNSSLEFEAIASFSTLYSARANIDEDWRNWGYLTFAQINKQNFQSFNRELRNLWKKQEQTLWPENKPKEIGLVSLKDVPFFNNNQKQYLHIVQFIGLIVLIIALINFINLSIVRSTARAKEIGIRKAIGSRRVELIKQFIFESVFICFIVAPISLLLIELSKNYFFYLIDKQIPLEVYSDPVTFLCFVVGILFIGLISGIYPALFLSSYKSISILKGEITKGKKKTTLRFVLFIIQFIISTSLLVIIFSISNQIQFLKNKPLGLNINNIIHSSQSEQINQKYDVFKQQCLQNPNVLSISRSNHSLARDFNISTGHEVNGEKKTYWATTVDPDFIPTMDIEMVKGRAFSWDISSDLYSSIIVNETFVNEFELEEPVIGKKISFLNIECTIIGIMKDFHYNSFHHSLKPSALWYSDWNARIHFKLNSQNRSETIQYIEKIWNKMSPQNPFEYQFLDETYNKLYQNEEKLHSIISTFALIAIMIAFLGLFGLVSYHAQQRAKEFGIRKVLGASTTSLINLLSQDYIRWVILGSLISFPIAYLFIQKWLQNFAYRTPLSFFPFLTASLAMLIVALITVFWGTIQTAKHDPVEVLKYE